MLHHIYNGYTRLHIFSIIVLPNIPFINTILLINSIAIFLSFNSARFFDPTAFERFANKYKISIIKFHFVNFIIHFLPIIYCSMRTISIHVKQASLISCLSQCMWPIIVHRTMYLNKPYIYFPKRIWHVMWLVAILSHIISGIVLNNKTYIL